MMVVQWKVRPFWCREFMINCWRSIEFRMKGATVLLIDFIRWYGILIKYADIEIESTRMITINHYFSFHRKSSSSPLFFCVIWLTIIRKWFFHLWLNWSEDSMPSDLFYRLPRFNSPIQIFIIRRQSGFCFYWLRSRAVRMKIIARSSVRRFFFAPSLLSLMIPRLLFLQIRFFSASRSTQCGSALSDVLIFLWDGNPSQIVTTQWDFSFRSGIYSGVLAGMLSFLPMVFLSEGDNFRYKFDIEPYWQFIH